jgi:hypothetical protein
MISGGSPGAVHLGDPRPLAPLPPRFSLAREKGGRALMKASKAALDTDQFQRRLLRENPRLKKDFDELGKCGCSIEKALRLAERVSAMALMRELAKYAFQKETKKKDRQLFGVPQRELLQLPQRLDDRASTVERLNKSLLMSYPAACIQGGVHPADDAEILRKAPDALRRYSKWAAANRQGALRLTPLKHLKAKSDASLAAFLYELRGGPSAAPPFEAAARMLNAARDLDEQNAELKRFLPKKPYTADTLRKFYRRLKLRQVLGVVR